VTVVGVESTACTVNEQVWGVDGVPLIVPVEDPSVRFVHNVPADMVHVIGDTQFDVPTVCE
jgi:hypothetical protein